MKYKFIILVLISFSILSCSKDTVLEEVDASQFISGTIAITEAEEKLFDLINQHRKNLQLNTLSLEATSYHYAGEHTDYMISKGNTSHDKFEERAKAISDKTGAKFVAENVAKDYDTVEEALEAWLESSGHKKNIEGEYTHSALSIKEDSNGNLYFTQIFFR
ncbi:CAP domain-containing protein [Maribacter sp. 2304DJ31-5]|uniref:CAP domain-containing protein n=1 Tax=Maribacter sp. 2304DJ31-5 TaxID=3386273 RepID=UPI0039BD6655